MPRYLAVGWAIFAFVVAHGGSYNSYFDFPDQVLPFDDFGDPPASVLAPAGVYRGLMDNTVLELREGYLVASDPDGGNAGEYSALAVVAQPVGSTFAGGAMVHATVSGITLENIRDGVHPGVAAGITIVDEDGGTYFLAAINRTQAGPDYFDTIAVGGVANRSQLVPGTGYIAVWEINAATPASVIASTPIPSGILPDTEFGIAFSPAGIADFYVNQAPLLLGHALAAQPDRAGLVVMNWGAATGNLPYQDVSFGAFSASGDEVPDGGVPGIPLGAWVVGVLTAALLAGAAAQMRHRAALLPLRGSQRGFRGFGR